MPTEATASVVVPAHQEGAVIERCLRALLADARPGELEVVVVANGCTDDTVARARAAAAELRHPVTVLDLAQPSKALALQAGDRVAHAFPRLYLDADVVCPTRTARALVDALSRPGVELAVPARDLDLEAAGSIPRAYYTAWSSRPRVVQMLAGRGCYALSRRGRTRVGLLPDGIADDLYVTTAVPRARTRVVEEPVRISPPGTVSALLAVRTRVYAGNAQLTDGQLRDDVAPKAPVGHGASSWSALAVYAVLTAVAKWRARAAVRRGEVAWGRDLARGGGVA